MQTEGEPAVHGHLAHAGASLDLSTYPLSPATSPGSPYISPGPSLMREHVISPQGYRRSQSSGLRAQSFDNDVAAARAAAMARRAGATPSPTREPDLPVSCSRGVPKSVQPVRASESTTKAPATFPGFATCHKPLEGQTSYSPSTFAARSPGRSHVDSEPSIPVADVVLPIKQPRGRVSSSTNEKN